MKETDALLGQLRKLALKKHVSLGMMMSSSRQDFDLLLTLAAMALPSKSALTEPEVNALLKDWLKGAGQMLDVDHVELRRWLADSGLVQRDKAGSRYQQHIAAEPYAALVAALQGVDVDRYVGEIIQSEQSRRAARKAAWQEKDAA